MACVCVMSEIQIASAWSMAAQHPFFLCGRVGEGCILFIKNLQITTWFLAIYSDKLCEKEVALHTLLFFLFYTFLCSTSSRRYSKCIKGNSWLDGWR